MAGGRRKEDPIRKKRNEEEEEDGFNIYYIIQISPTLFLGCLPSSS